MTQAEQDLQNALVTQYFSNLEFFTPKPQNPVIYHKKEEK
jgi:hypothetical protein